MAEISHRALRELIEHFNVTGEQCPDEYFSEMLSAGAVTQSGPFEAYYLDSGPCPEKFVYQICGAKTEALVRAAAFLDTKECLGIDINMGCSAPAIIKSGSGGGWLSRYEESAAMVRAVRAVTSKRLSIKMRLCGGGEGVGNDFDLLVRFAKMLEDEGVQLITLHPRTTKGKFNTEAKVNYVGELAALLKIPVAGNGFIPTAAALSRYINEGRYHALMIGRLAVKQPWIFAQARSGDVAPSKIDASIFDGEELALLFLELLMRYQPKEFLMSRAQRFFGYYCSNFKWGEHFKNLLFREKTIPAMQAVIKNFFKEVPEERDLMHLLTGNNYKDTRTAPTKTNI
jgi:tRNA-dihydrouridine synthase